MSGKGGPIGNQYHKGKLVTDAIRKAAVQNDYKRLNKGVDSLMNAFEAGEPWAIEQVINRLEGRPAQSLTVDATIDATVRAAELSDDALATIASSK